jgi:uncharacterized membrane protein
MIYLILCIVVIIVVSIFINKDERRRDITRRDLVDLSKRGMFDRDVVPEPDDAIDWDVD